MPSFEGNLLTRNFADKKLETLGYHTVKTRSLYLTWDWFGIPGRTFLRTFLSALRTLRTPRYS